MKNPFRFLKKLNPVPPAKKGIDRMNKQIALGLARHLLTTAGGIAVSHGYLQGSDVDGVVGAVLLLVGVIWSAFHKVQAAK